MEPPDLSVSYLLSALLNSKLSTDKINKLNNNRQNKRFL